MPGSENIASSTVRNPSPWLRWVRSASQKPGSPDTFWARLNKVSARRKNPLRWRRGPATSRHPAAVKSASIASPSGVLAPVLAYVVPALPPAELILHTSAIASMIVDLPYPLSPTRNVTGAVKSRPSLMIWATTGMVNGHRSPTPGRRPLIAQRAWLDVSPAACRPVLHQAAETEGIPGVGAPGDLSSVVRMPLCHAADVPTHVALLRGVNNLGGKKVAMAGLREVVTSLG